MKKINSHPTAITNSPALITRKAIVFVFFLYIAWIGAWLFKRWLEIHFELLLSDMSSSCYWLVMKVLLWILPVVVLIKQSGQNFQEVIGLQRIRAIIGWGGGIGLILGIIAVITKLLGHQPLFEFHLSWTFFSGVIVAPVTEEITFRGWVLEALKRRYNFPIANLITGIFFLGAHLPGWYFQGRLLPNLVTPIGGALSIFLLGLVFGYVAHQSKSIAGSILTHLFNNFFNT